MTQRAQPRLGELLVQEGLITEGQLHDALRNQQQHGGKLVQNLIALQYIDHQAFLRFLSRQPGTASIEVLNYTISPDVINLVDAEFALRHEVLPIDKMGSYLTVGMACPLDRNTVLELEQMTGCRVKSLLVSMNDVRVALERYYRPGKLNKRKLSAAAIVGKPDAPRTLPQEEAAGSAPTKIAEADLPSRPDTAAEPVTAPEAAEAPAPQAPTQPNAEASLELVDSALRMEKIVHLVHRIEQLPALPETVGHAREVMAKPDAKTRDMTVVIEKDPGIHAKVLSMANSAAYGFSHEVELLELAVSLLGLREVYNLVLTSAVVDYFELKGGFDYQRFWQRSMICGIASRTIARKSVGIEAAGAFSAGFLHDIGRPTLAVILPNQYDKIDQEQPDEDVIAQENEQFGMAHPEVGYLLADNWGLPKELAHAMRYHYDVSAAPREHQRLVGLVSLAALLAENYGRLDRGNIGAFIERCRDSLDALKLTQQQFVVVLGESSAAIKAQLHGKR